jgi:hypothetical protein
VPSVDRRLEDVMTVQRLKEDASLTVSPCVKGL